MKIYRFISRYVRDREWIENDNENIRIKIMNVIEIESE